MSNKLTEWKNLPLNKVFDIARGGSPRPIKNYITEGEDGINWIKIGDTKNSSKYIYNTKQKIKSEGVKKSQLVKEDDFILSNSMSFGKPYIMKTRGCIHDGWLVLRKVSKETSIDYMYYLLSSSVIKNQFENKAAGSTVRNLNIKLVSSVKVSIPPYPEQRKIADILSTVDEKLALIDQQVTATEEFKKGLMQRLLTKGIGHTEFKESPLGEIPKSWEVKKIGEILKLGSGKDYKHLEKGEIPVYGTGGYMLSVNEYLYDGESVGIGRKGTIDKPVFLKGKFWTVDTLFYTHSFKNVLPYFVFILFQSIDWYNHNEATGVPSLSKVNIEAIKIALPKLDEQKKIIEIIEAISAKRSILLSKKLEYQQLKKGLMQQLLTGKIRVNNLVEA